MSANVFHM